MSETELSELEAKKLYEKIFSTMTLSANYVDRCVNNENKGKLLKI